MEDATELEYLKWFRYYADFGQYHEDVCHWLDKQFERETGKKVPKEWKEEGHE